MIQRKLAPNEYLVPVTYEVCGFVPVIADSPEDAFNKVCDDDGTCPLPEDRSYVDGSFEIGCDTPEAIQAYTDNYNTGQLMIELSEDGWEGPERK